MTTHTSPVKLNLHAKGAKAYYSTQLSRISNKTENEVWLLDNFRDFLKKKFEIERECYDKLEKLSRSTQKAILKASSSKIPLESTTATNTPTRSSIVSQSPSTSTASKESFETFSTLVGLTETKARHGIEIIDRLNSEVLDHVRDFSKLKLAQSQKYCEAWKGMLEHIEFNLLQLNDAKMEYDDAVKLYDHIEHKHTDALNGRSSLFANMKHALSSVTDEQRLEKLSTKLKLAHQRMTHARNMYLLHLVSCNVSQHQFWDHDLPFFLSKFDDDDGHTFASSIVAFAQAEKAFFRSMMDQLDALEQRTGLVDLRKERQAYFQENEKYFSGKSIFEFEPKGNDNICRIISDEYTKSSLSAKLSELILQRTSCAKLLETNTKELSGLSQMAKLYEKNPEFGNVNDVMGSKINLELTTITFENQLKQHEEQIKLLENAGVEMLANNSKPETTTSFPTSTLSPMSSQSISLSQENTLSTSLSNRASSLLTASVLYPYTATVEGGVTVEPGQTVHILEGDADGWTKVRINGQEGYVPSNYIKVEQDHPISNEPPPTSHSTKRLSSPHPVKVQEKIYVTSLLDYTALNPGELSMVAGDTIEVLQRSVNGNGESGEWWTGKNARTGQEGLFPHLFTQQLHITSSTASNVAMSSAVEKVKAIYDYRPSCEDELELHVGDIIEVTNKDTGSDAWWMGTNLNTHHSGQFPKTYTGSIS